MVTVLFSCVGVIFGVIGIVKANKANTYYEAGYDELGDNANSTARTMTILAFVFAGIGLIGSLYFINSSGLGSLF